jgi:hypothetical protein
LDQPRIPESKFPVEERESIQSINTALGNLESYCSDFKCSLALFDFCDASGTVLDNTPGLIAFKEQLKFNSWLLIAARAGGIDIYNFGRTRDAINIGLRAAPTLRKLVFDKHAAANKLFGAHFANYMELRQSIAHIAEADMTPQKRKEHAIAGPAHVEGIFRTTGADSNVILSSGLNGRKYTSTWLGEPCSYEISESTLHNLECEMRSLTLLGRRRLFKIMSQLIAAGNPRPG